MRKIFLNIFFIAILSQSIISCSKQLDQTPVSSTTTGNFYSNANDFKQAVTGAYAQLNNFPEQALWLGEMRSDNINAVSDGNRDWDGINNFSTSIGSTTFISDAWQDNFNGIYNVNSVLEALDEKGSILTNTSLKTRYYGELYFLRAFYYFQLVKEFGQVPIVTTPVTVSEITQIPRSEVSDVYNLIVSDLKQAINILPATYDAADIGRATLGAANALAGQVYLTKSGPTYDINGPGINANQYDSASYYFDQVINSGTYSLQNNYTDIFSYTNENNSEVIFDVQAKSGTNGSAFPSYLVPVAYWVSLGISNSYGNGYGTSVFNITNNLKTSYEPSGTVQDIRDTFNINYTYKVSTFFKKYININYKGSNGKDWPINFIVLRYADILLMKAESILNGGTGSTAEALGYVNQIRARAGLSALTSLTISSLLEERRREFAGEGLRWNDLIREGQAVTTINSWIASDGLSSQISNATNNSILYPIPTAQISTSNGLYTQNPGY
ncbi:RagB/SusD family nutrient uptake outer membrane protein [Rhizosphaericola mali]|uniref:RagB/SusD family nutrient uptake outer membrane protein n=1 Tax=Rhizosphaericola mali TaxID=2545455 RepID=A0A5P2FX83_9BACT|nr:RagB/SusD family nutrient uptake outer membrane protein [Rhizosphaericola mali]QES88124.1 RagB/SusD family nutrient uptake outer membrane protein [Rhizosphaericola mali]